MRDERGLGNNLVCGQSLVWDISNMGSIANTKVRFKLSLFKECMPINEILGAGTEGLQILINYLLQQATFW